MMTHIKDCKEHLVPKHFPIQNENFDFTEPEYLNPAGEAFDPAREDLNVTEDGLNAVAEGMEIDEPRLYPDLAKEAAMMENMDLAPASANMTIDYSFIRNLWSKEPQSVKRNNPTDAFIEKVLKESKIPIIKMRTGNPVVDQKYYSVVGNIRKRFIRHMEKVRRAGGENKAKQELKDEIMFNLEKEENLIQVEQFLEGDDLPLSQESGASAYSLPLSDMEIDLPVRPKPPIPPKKKLEDCNPNYQRCKTNDLYQHCIEKSKEYDTNRLRTVSILEYHSYLVAIFCLLSG